MKFIIGVGMFLVTGIMVIGSFGYELGIFSPKFRVGDCLIYNDKSEFYRPLFQKRVENIGKREYLLFAIYIQDGSVLKNQTGESIQYIDKNYIKVGCVKE